MLPQNCLHRILAALFAANLIGGVLIHAADPAPEGASSRSVQIEFLMVDAAPGTVPADTTGEQIMEMVKQQKFLEITRLKLSALHEQSTEVQFGVQAPVEVSRMQTSRGEVGNVQYQNHGLTVQVTPAIQADNSLALEFIFSRSRLAPVKAAAPAPEGSAKSFSPPKMEQFQAKTRLRVASGKPLVVAQREQAGPDGATTLLVVVATITP